MDTLKAQLAGEHCRFDYASGAGCKARSEGFWQWLLREPHHCDEAAVLCLGEIKTPASYDALIGVLRSKTNIETCDGGYPIRSLAVEFLGESRYTPAIEPLRELLASGPVETYSSGASGCSADPEPVEVITDALTRLSASSN